jgi:hypothetical protein
VEASCWDALNPAKHQLLWMWKYFWTAISAASNQVNSSCDRGDG